MKICIYLHPLISYIVFDRSKMLTNFFPPLGGIQLEKSWQIDLSQLKFVWFSFSTQLMIISRFKFKDTMEMKFLFSMNCHYTNAAATVLSDFFIFTLLYCNLSLNLQSLNISRCIYLNFQKIIKKIYSLSNVSTSINKQHRRHA